MIYNKIGDVISKLSNTTSVNVRVINPVEMFLFQYGWYCAAYCELQKSFSHFTVEKILENKKIYRY